MAIDTRPSVRSDKRIIPAPSERVTRHAGQWRLRTTLVALATFMALTAIPSAIFVVPAMPRSALHSGVLALFPDYTIPALALGVLCGGSAVLALVTVLVRPRLGALASVVAGAFMLGFELVEIVVVGFTPAQSPDQVQAWLQVVYLIIGAALVLLGARLWKAETGSYRLRRATA